MSTATETPTTGQVTCPPWCTADHSRPELFPQDLDHCLDILTRVDEDNYLVCQVSLSWRPFAEPAGEREPQILLLVGDELDGEMTAAEARVLARVFGRGNTLAAEEVSAALLQAAETLQASVIL